MNDDSSNPQLKAIASSNGAASETEQSFHSALPPDSGVEEGNLERFFTLSIDMLCIAGFDGYFKRLNPIWEKTLGYTQAELLAEPYLDFIHPDDRESTIAEARKLADVGINTIAFENRYRCKDGSYRWLLWNATPFPERQLLYCVAHDITERKRAEFALQRQLEIDRLIANISTRFINLPCEQISDGLDRALQEIGQFAGVDSSFVFRFSDNLETPIVARQWVAEGIESRLDRAPSLLPESFPRLHCEQQDRNVIEVANVAELPEIAGGDRDRAFPFAAFVAVSLSYEGEAIGWVGLGSLKPVRNWSRGYRHLLRMVGEIITNALQRQQAETEIRQLNSDLEQRVLERTAQLAATNEELESFCYSVSHDLRAPLRGIDGFSQALLEDYEAVLDDIGQDFLQRIRAATQRMGQAIDDLLALSRVTRQELRWETVDLSALAAEIVELLQQTDRDRQVDVAIAIAPEVRGDDRLLRVMLENLLGNAWKFTSKTPQAQIEFGTLPEAEGLVYFVRDNGAGFDMAYADKLFGPFQRLHRMAEFSGTGIGLATVKRIINRHRGRVWAEAEVDRGATFFFTL
ncbi:ATP-binding protein [Synechococcus sp. PCC 7336]|uniref:PAS domain-containing sensor histidine kinase n=1 Tax=Synechococcus sp. PCC 7336 TaxID=195250 RepID=UPI0003452790|nr:ATP-binding protein [Synechococcus sp. PCC 7336]